LGASEAAPPAGFGAAVSTSKNYLPTCTVSPCLAKSYVMAPAAGDLISTCTLSVSIKATISSN